MGKKNKVKNTNQYQKKYYNNNNNNNQFLNILSFVLLIISIIGFYYYYVLIEPTPSTGLRQTPSSKKAKLVPPDHWEQEDLWRVTSKNKDKRIYNSPVENGGGYTSVSIYEKIPRSSKKLEKKWIEYGVEKIRYLILEPSIGIQGFSCLTCEKRENEEGKLYEHCIPKYQKNSTIHPPCLMEPNQGMLNLAISVPSSFDCKSTESKILMLGLGNGAMSSYANFYFKSTIDVVEINEKLCDFKLLNYLGNHPNSSETKVTLFNEDAEKWVARKCDTAEKKKHFYDLILSDMAGEDSMPPFMINEKWITEIKCLLAENGVFIANLLGGLNSPKQQKSKELVINVIDNFIKIFGPEWNFYFMETGYFNRILHITKSKLSLDLLKRLTKEKAKECGTPEMIRGLDFWSEIDNSTPEKREKWISTISEFQTKRAWETVLANHKG